MSVRKGLFSAVFLLCAPIIVFSSFVFWTAPLGLGFSGDASTKLQSPFVMMAYWVFFLSVPISVFGALPFSVAMAGQEATRRLGFQTLIGCAFILIPLHFLFILWLSS